MIIRVLIILIFSQYTFSQKVDNTMSLKIAVGSEMVIYGLTMYGLNELWYRNYPKSQFHWIDDNDNWLQMDKLGHATTAYNMALLGNNIFQWSGVSQKKALWYGGMYGMVFLTSVEILDGFSKGWGASYGDLIANTLGSSLFIGQELLFKDQKVLLKYSFASTEYSKQRPDLLGKNRLEQAIKDYNGQIYWLSFNPIHMSKTNFPQWLNLAVGYGADGMLNGNKSDVNRTREFYLSPDINLRKIKTNSAFLNKTLSLLNFMKIPMPAVKLADKKLTFYFFHYGQ